ncbi:MULTISPECIES: ubiquinol oxidase subunit II [Vibrio]|uniref:Ubiquinol oxidase subunit 2 n=3 Tax=Vibrio campbellii TaxID=680 RepID=A0AAQ2Y1M7_9VIBR|nr:MULTISPECIES: ubiquinol oxidase subunit II [Vibrio]EDL69503.1 ubiquinol oxidase, subunit II [Vibrio campbellii HY01]ARR46364.1 cytochrome ubiquinol oxidase subunit II [Vibrio campbellii]AUV88295.1 ubiquinol oxidase subunit II [Vibrio campbellii]AUW05987.1 ubiquinol oxidase subunit II [Vibrio campbellii]AYO12055.1 ubiquinol oxidase subunit II [Vibrio campbellii]
MEASRYTRILSRISLVATILMLAGCNSALLDPKGSIGVQEKELIITALLLMLIVVIPVILMTIYFAYRYRESNTGEEYAPDWSHSTKIEVVVWTIPIIIIAILAAITWRSTHELEPSKPIESDVKPITIEVVSLDWKWLFIYPEENIATVNYVAFPKDVPVQFKLTSDNIMNAFFIPRLGTQIYAMPGMVTKLNLIANHTGDYKGFASNYSGEGFSQMKFTASAMEDRTAFLNWVQQVKASPDRIEDWEQFRSLASPTVAEPVKLFSSVPPFLFTDVVTQHPGSMNCLPENLG